MEFWKELEFWLSSPMPLLLPLLLITFHVLSMHTNMVLVQIKGTDKKSNQDILCIYVYFSVEFMAISVITYIRYIPFTSLQTFTDVKCHSKDFAKQLVIQVENHVFPSECKQKKNCILHQFSDLFQISFSSLQQVFYCLLLVHSQIPVHAHRNRDLVFLSCHRKRV